MALHDHDEDTRNVSQDLLSLNLGPHEEAQKLLAEKKSGDRVNLRNVSGTLITLEDGRLTLQVDQVEFDKGSNQRAAQADGSEVVTPPVPDDNAPVLILLGEPTTEHRTDGSRRERDTNNANNVT